MTRLQKILSSSPWKRTGTPGRPSDLVSAHLRWLWMRSSRAQRVLLALVVLNVLALGYVWPAHTQLQSVQERMAWRQQQLAQRVPMPEAQQERDPAVRLWDFDSGFPLESAVPDALAQINAIVTAGQLRIDEAEYRLLDLPQSRLRAYQINMPLRGRYSNVLQVCLTLLEQVPNLSLNNVTFQRKAVADAQTEAVLSMTLYLRRP